jgi:glycosyltransferase involved in cell wall biosynthesis
MKILIALSTYNRPVITELCLQNLQAIRSETVKLFIYDDCSTAYNYQYLEKYADKVIRFSPNVGIELSRATAIRDFVFKHTEFDLIYFTDNDAIHDPEFINIIKGIRYLQNNNQQFLPFSLFNSVYHKQGIIKETEGYYIQQTIPGISQGYTRALAKTIVEKLNTTPKLDRQYGWDYIYTQILNLPCLVPKQSYVEHFARDMFEAGMHAKNSGTGVLGLQDFERDRALNPTEYLVNIRPAIINKILGIE